MNRLTENLCGHNASFASEFRSLLIATSSNWPPPFPHLFPTIYPALPIRHLWQSWQRGPPPGAAPGCCLPRRARGLRRGVPLGIAGHTDELCPAGGNGLVPSDRRHAGRPAGRSAPPPLHAGPDGVAAPHAAALLPHTPGGRPHHQNRDAPLQTCWPWEDLRIIGNRSHGGSHGIRQHKHLNPF